MAGVILDSSVLLAILNPGDAHHAAAIDHLRGRPDTFSISSITLVETMIYALRQSPSAGKRYKASIDRAIKVIVPVDEKVALEAARVRARSSMKTPDAIISATATLAGAELWTLDQKLAKAHKGAVLIA